MHTTALERLERALGTEVSAWHEYNVELAAEIISQFDVSDWGCLQTILMSRPAFWQERCAEAMGYVDNEDSIRTLISLLDTPHMSVAAIAASELDNMSVQLPARLASTLAALLIYLQEHQSPRSEDIRSLLQNLK